MAASFILLSSVAADPSLEKIPEYVPIFLFSLGLAFLLVHYINLNRIIQGSRDNFRSIIDSAPFGFILTDLDLTIKGTNMFVSRMLNVPIREMIGTELSDWLRALSRQEMEQAKGLVPGETITFSVVSCGAKRLRISVHRPLAGSNSIFWHVHDITDQYEIEQKFEVLFNSLPIGVLEAEPDGRVIAANPSTSAIAGCPKTPENTDSIFPKDIWNRINEDLTRGKEQVQGTIMPSKDKIISYSAQLFFQSGRPRVSCILQDITEESVLKQRLILALKEAEAADKAKSAFLAKMSHEIRTPLNAVTGLAFILKDKVKGREASELIQNIIDSSKHLAQLIGDILDLSKIESGKMELDQRPFSLAGLLGNLKENFSMLCGQRDLYFKMHIDDNIPQYVVGDPVRLKQIIYNIVGNSLKFVVQGGITFEAVRAGETDGLPLIRFRVIDTGPGIPEEKLDKIFDAFVQEENGQRAGGTGLGLAITRELLSLMHGSIKVFSEVGKGTTFQFTIPFKEASEEEIKALEAEEGVSSSMAPGRALVVDDVELNRKVLAMLLEGRGWETVQADDGQKAVEILKDDRDFACIFMDISMPGMDGIEATKLIKERLGLNIPIIGVSAHALAGSRQKYLAAGMDGYVTKPVNPEKLWREMASVIGCGHGEGATSSPPVHKGGEESSGQGPCQSIEHAPGKPCSAVQDDTGQGDDPLLDMDGLLKTCQGSKELAQELLADLVSEMPGWRDELKKILGAKDLKGIRRCCHRIRGTAGTIGAVPLERAAKDLGAAARNGQEDRLSSLAQELFKTMDATAEAVEAETNGSASA